METHSNIVEEDLLIELENVDFSHLSVYKSFVLSVLDSLSLSHFILSIVLCRNYYIQKLNNEFRKQDEPTDVLSFNYLEENGKILSEIEGDLFISLEYLDLSAKEFNVPLYEELERVTIHGILHLMGYNHETNDFLNEKMLILQENILAKNKGIF